jgi:ribonuclease HI
MPLAHACLETLETLTYCQPHLSCSPLPDPDVSGFIDGSSSLDSEGKRRAGYAVVSLTKAIESSPLPWGTTSQKAEFIALTRVLTLAKDKKANIYTDSKYAYHIIHYHVILWEERGFLTTKGTSISNRSLILKLLKASYLPAKVAVIHCKGHQPETTEIAQGNAFADNKAKRANTRLLPWSSSQPP